METRAVHSSEFSDDDLTAAQASLRSELENGGGVAATRPEVAAARLRVLGRSGFLDDTRAVQAELRDEVAADPDDDLTAMKRDTLANPLDLVSYATVRLVETGEAPQS